MLRRASTMFAAVALALCMSSLAVAADCRKKIDLSSTGAVADVSGTAEVRAQGAQQRFKVSIDAPDGMYAVYANGLFAGPIKVVLGNGELDINNNNGKTLPAGVDPVCSITSVRVDNAGGTSVLTGAF